MTRSTTVATVPHNTNSTPIRSATGTPLRNSISNRECATESAVSVVKPTTSQRIGRYRAPTTAVLIQRDQPIPSGGSSRNRSRKYVLATTPYAQMSTGMQSRNKSPIPTPSPMCESSPIMRIGRANTVTGLANTMTNPSAILASKLIRSMAMKRSAKASLIGNPVQKVNQRSCNASFTGEGDSWSVIPYIRRAPARLSLLIQKLAVDDGGHRENKDRSHHDDPSDQRNRTLEDVPLRVAIDKGQRSQKRHKGSWQCDCAQELPELAGKNFQPQHLKEEQEVPFGLRMIITRVRRGFFQQNHRLPKRHRTDRQKHGDHSHNVLPDLSREEIIAFDFQLFDRSTKW